ncbi:MAG TPA: IclR family transcriptional regulator [Dermatophilaceae bacterium]|nr:IclR family transcriptional regulator [Dermatophilaceae bacterium]
MCVMEHSGRSVTSKALALLDSFTSKGEDLSLSELSARTGLPLSTAYRIACELVEWGALERVRGGGYRLGMRLWELGSLAARQDSLVEVVRPYMFDLYAATLESVHLAVLDAGEVLYVEKITGRHAFPSRSRVGGRLPLHATAAGKVLLAYAPDEVVEAVAAAGLRRYTRHTIVSPLVLRRALSEVRRTGLGVSWGELTLGSASVAAAVFGRGGQVAAALSLTLRSSPAQVQRLGMAVRTAALSASRELLAALGQRPTHPWPLQSIAAPLRPAAMVPHNEFHSMAT